MKMEYSLQELSGHDFHCGSCFFLFPRMYLPRSDDVLLENV